jgi:hypothetical protein
MKTEATTFDRIVQKIKDNRIIACILIFGTFVIVFSQFTDATEKIINIFSGKPATANISGTWKTEMLKDPWFTDTKYKYIFEFQKKGNMVDGILKRFHAEGKDYSMSIFGGEVQENFVSFYITESLQSQKTLVTGSVVWETVPYKVIFKGTVTGNKIDFLVSSDRSGMEPWRIEAERETN